MVMDAVQNLDKTFGDVVQIFQGQLALIQLTVREDFIDQVLHQTLNP